VKYLILLITTILINSCNQQKAEEGTELDGSNIPVEDISNSGGSPGELIDHVIQDTCIDDEDQPIAGDPYNCLNKRNLKVGESLLYVTTDHIQNGLGVQAVSSIPVHSTDGSLRIIHSKDFERDFLN
jgi:hypothetical protein